VNERKRSNNSDHTPTADIIFYSWTAFEICCGVLPSRNYGSKSGF
jgi:hypothetical protein